MHHVTSRRDSFYLEENLWQKGRNVILFVTLIALLACAGRIHFGSCAVLSLVPGEFFLRHAPSCWVGMFFVMVQYLTGSAWSVTVRRFMETIMASVPAGLLLFIPVAFGVHELYAWTNPEVIAKEAVVRGKIAYLNPQMFTLARRHLLRTLEPVGARDLPAVDPAG